MCLRVAEHNYPVAGVPLTLACAMSWAGYRTAARKNRQLPR